MIAHLSIVRNMHLYHQQIVIANGGHHSSAFGSAMNIDELANLIAIADSRFTALAMILQVLSRNSDRRVRKENVVFANRQRTFQKNMRFSLVTRTNIDIRSDNAVGT